MYIRNQLLISSSDRNQKTFPMGDALIALKRNAKERRQAGAAAHHDSPLLLPYFCNQQQLKTPCLYTRVLIRLREPRSRITLGELGFHVFVHIHISRKQWVGQHVRTREISELSDQEAGLGAPRHPAAFPLVSERKKKGEPAPAASAPVLWCPISISIGVGATIHYGLLAARELIFHTIFFSFLEQWRVI
jgi:hypothetical protein